ncbi:MAG: hypothetical protein PHP57_05720 [Sideroxydans sp.]|nr:hypothetical protein [Sideroxydans sp.]
MQRFLLIVLYCISTLTYATEAVSYKDLLERQWYGYSSFSAPVFQGGIGRTYERLYDVQYNEADDTFWAEASSMITIGGQEYAATAQVVGEVNKSSHKVKFHTYKRLRSNALPGSLYWINKSVDLLITKDTDHPGYYILEEIAADGTETVYTDRDY